MTNTTISERIAATITRLGLDETRAAAYFGVPLSTYRKWCNGTRIPGAAVVRLLDVLGTVETLSPALHDALTPEGGNSPTRRPGRPVKNSLRQS